MLCKMAEDGAKFDSTIVIPENFNPIKPEEEEDATSPKGPAPQPSTRRPAPKSLHLLLSRSLLYYSQA